MTEPRRPAGPGCCVLCGADEWALIYPASARGVAGIDEFSCTTSAVSVHDDIVECRTCGLRSSVPLLDPAAIIERYQAVVDDEYLAEQASRRETFDWLLDRLEEHHDGGRRLIEFGSNVGLFLSVAKARGWDEVGIEPSNWAVETGRKQFGVNLHQGTIEASDHPSASFDAGVLLDVLEHLVDPGLALGRLADLIVADGLLLLSTVDVKSLHSRTRGKRWPWYIRSHLHYFSNETLGALLEASGFEVLYVANVPRSFRASYILRKGGWSESWWGRGAQRLLGVVNPRIPTGWLGDIKVVVARRS